MFYLMRKINRATTISAIAVLSRILCFGGEPVHTDWIEADRTFVAQVKSVLTNDPQHIDQVLSPTKRDDLGFGYSLGSYSGGKGYLSFGCEMLYSNNTLVSFRIAPCVCMTPNLNLDAIYTV